MNQNFSETSTEYLLRQHRPDISFAYPTSEIPSCFGANNSLDSFSPFVYDADDPDDFYLPTLGPYKFVVDSSIYIGQ